jgi:ribonuclease BN (tRNA processing enzyme)
MRTVLDPTMHSIPTTAFRIKAAGRTFAFSADSAYDPTLIDWLSPADLIVHEATTLDESPVHTPYAHLAALPKDLRAKMRLSHLPDDFDAATSAIETLQEGRCYPV